MKNQEPYIGTKILIKQDSDMTSNILLMQSLSLSNWELNFNYNETLSSHISTLYFYKDKPNFKG